MKQEIIRKDEVRINNEKRNVNKLIATINRYTDRLNNEKQAITLTDILEMCTNYKAYQQKVFLSKLKEICEMFCLDYEQAKTTDYYLSGKGEIFYNMASAKSELLRQMAQDIRNFDHFTVSCISIENNVAAINEDAESRIKDKFTYKTLNDKQAEATKILKQMQELNTKLVKLGYRKTDFKHLIKLDGSLDEKLIHAVS